MRQLAAGMLIILILAGGFYFAKAQNLVWAAVSGPLPATQYLPFDYLVWASSPNQPISYQLMEGPDWLAFQSGHRLLTGVPLEKGSYPVRLRAVDASGQSSDLVFKIEVIPSLVFQEPTVVATEEIPLPPPVVIEAVAQVVAAIEEEPPPPPSPALLYQAGTAMVYTPRFLGRCPNVASPLLSLLVRVIEGVLEKTLEQVELELSSLPIWPLAEAEAAPPCAYSVGFEIATEPGEEYQDRNSQLVISAVQQVLSRPEIKQALASQGVPTEDVGIDFNHVITHTSHTQTAVPNDEFLSSQYALNSPGDQDIDAFEGWGMIKEEIDKGAPRVPVAVVDSGVDYLHPDLKDNIWRNPGEVPDNRKDDDGNGLIDDSYGYNFRERNNQPLDDVGHGSHVAGTIGAVGDNKKGVAGVAWQAVQLVSLKVYNSLDTSITPAFVNSVQPALEYALWKKFPVVNMSIDTAGNNYGIRKTVEALNKAGILQVVAAGNFKNDNDRFEAFPANYPDVMTVAATDQKDQFAAFFSSYGKKNVALAAPGVKIKSTVPRGDCQFCDPTGYRSLDGTSMAAPMVAGAFALAKALAPKMEASTMRQLLAKTVDPLPSLSDKTSFGGRLNLHNFLAKVLEMRGAEIGQVGISGKKVEAGKGKKIGFRPGQAVAGFFKKVLHFLKNLIESVIELVKGSVG